MQQATKPRYKRWRDMWMNVEWLHHVRRCTLQTLHNNYDNEEKQEERSEKHEAWSNKKQIDLIRPQRFSTRDDKFAYDLHSDLIYSTAETIKLEKNFFHLLPTRTYFYVACSDPRYTSRVWFAHSRLNLKMQSSERMSGMVGVYEVSHHNLNANSKF